MSRPVLRHLTALALAAGVLSAVSPPAVAAPDGSGVVINEIFVRGGSAGAAFQTKFVELLNPTDQPVDVSGWSVQYRSAAGGVGGAASFTGVTALGDHEIAPGGTLLIGGGSNGSNGAELPTPDVTGAINPAAASGVIALVSSTTALAGLPADVLAADDLVDLVGYGAATTFEGSAAPGDPSLTESLGRSSGADTDQNGTDFVKQTPPTPQACGDACDIAPPPIETVTIDQIQGTGAASPLVGQTVTTTGVVTAVYATGGFNGAYLQTPGTGGPLNLDEHQASHGLYAYGSSFAQAVELGDTVAVTGPVSEFNGLTQITPTDWEPAAEPGAVTPTPVTFPMTEAQRESLEGMLVDATGGDFTITNNYATNTYGELGLAAGDEPLPQPTQVVRPRTSAYDRLVRQNAERLITLDDGRTANYTSGANRDVAVPWLSGAAEVRTGAQATIDDPLVLDFRNGLWKLQPVEPFGAGDESATVSTASTREPAPEAVGGSLSLASFNVLNYFTTTGEDWVQSGRGTCTWYSDRAGDRITVNSCTNDGPRGAANDASLARQQGKIVTAINTLDADVVSLEEIEDTGSLGGPDRDEALKTLVAALNDAAGGQKWAAVLSPEAIPTTGRDVIRTAFIYQPAAVEPVGPSVIWDAPAFVNARAPLAQEFRPVDGDAGQDFVAIVNHFKSKGSGTGADADAGDGQGASNRSRVAQAESLIEFVSSLQVERDTDRVFLMGDFNSYAMEDPLQIVEDAGFVNVERLLDGERTYQFDGLHGSLDHVYASPAAFAGVTGADVWSINAAESIGREYSRFNNNVTSLFDAISPYRASDHDPVLVGYDPGPAEVVATTMTARAPQTVWSDESFDLAIEVAAATGSARGRVAVRAGDSQIGSAEVADGRATVTVPAGALAPGRRQLTVEFVGEGRYGDSQSVVTVDVRAPMALTATTSGGVYGRASTITVTGARGAYGLVYATAAGRVVGAGIMLDGTARIAIAGTAVRPGSTPLTVFYGGGSGFEPAHTAVTLTIAKATATVKARSLTAKIVKNRRSRVRVAVRTAGLTENAGVVRIYRGSRQVGVAKVRRGVAVVKIAKLRKAGRTKLSVRYSGSATTKPARSTLRVRVR